MSKVFEGKRILIVDDDPDIVTAIKALLDGKGAELQIAGDGNLAMDRAEEFAPDLIVLDAMLPKRSGFLVLEKLKANKKKGEAPLIIMITGNEGKRHQMWAQSLGVDDYINKPFRMERLLEAIESQLSKL